MLKRKGVFNFIDGVEPGIRRVHEVGVMSALSEIDKLPRRIETHYQTCQFSKNTKDAKKTKRIYLFFKLKYIQMIAKKPLERVLKAVLFLFKYGHLKLARIGLFKN
jgi:hypothetical protein